jgi:23S rRNA (uracil1939-C5)-methyltransferase
MRIERVAAGGDGVGRLADGRVAFVPRTAPGDLALVTVTQTAKRFVRARLAELLEAGPDRVEPACPHYRDDDCGGCQLQHLSPEGQLGARRGILMDAMTRIAKLAVEPPSVRPSPDQWAYRSKITLTAARAARAAGAASQYGYHRVGRPDATFSLDRCLIAAEPINALWARVNPNRRLLPDLTTRVGLRLDRTGGDHLIVETAEGPAWTGAKALWSKGAAERPLTIWWRPEGGAARVVAGAATAYPATAFEQVHPAMGDQARAFAIEQLGPVSGKRIWDLYAGIGETSSLLAQAGARVIGVESDGTAVAEAERTQQSFGDTIERVTGRCERVVGSLADPDLVIANPPRTGMDEGVVREIRSRRPERFVYLSCDPATLARDLARLVEGNAYRIVAMKAFDLFPQTAHLETVAVMERA